MSRQTSSGVLALVAAVAAAGCGEDGFVEACVERFNGPVNEQRSWVAKSGREPGFGPAAEPGFRAPVWLGRSKLREEKCVAVVGLGGEENWIVLREDFHRGAKPGVFVALGGFSEGSEETQRARLREPVAGGRPDGMLELR